MDHAGDGPDVRATRAQPGDRAAPPLHQLYTRPLALLSVLCAAQFVVWSVAPMLANDTPPLDVVENTAWAPEWIIGSYKNPTLSSAMLEFARLATGAGGWPAYLVSQLFICATFVLVFLLGSGRSEPSGH